jgi:hypothetical protein
MRKHQSEDEAHEHPMESCALAQLVEPKSRKAHDEDTGDHERSRPDRSGRRFKGGQGGGKSAEADEDCRAQRENHDRGLDQNQQRYPVDVPAKQAHGYDALRKRILQFLRINGDRSPAQPPP